MKPMVDSSGGGGPSFSGHSLSSPDAESAKPEPPHDSGARASLEQVTVDHTKPPDSGSAKPVTVDHKSATSDSSTGTESDGGGEPSSASSSLPAAAHPFGRALAVVDGVASVAISCRGDAAAGDGTIACHPGSSLVVVMAQAIAHRVTQVWVVDADDGELVGVVRFLDVLSALADELATNEEGSKIDGGQKPPVPTNFAKFVGRSVTSGLDDACMIVRFLLGKTRVNSGWWPGKIRRLEGPWLFSFAGAARPGSAKSIRSELIAGVGGGAATVDVLGFGSGCGGGSAVWGAGERPQSRTCAAPHSSFSGFGPRFI
uniref:CBS domain-containing protein n=1 Tax=Oryza nivara TaxID=4536 RepID=A0A0E0HDC5_ORYNI